ncbi:MAG: hypothetical protein F4Z25_06790 [Chloroflexi bacterium]|nr:hypothetical protein [Chloroflexota bacterium]
MLAAIAVVVLATISALAPLYSDTEPPPNYTVLERQYVPIGSGIVVRYIVALGTKSTEIDVEIDDLPISGCANVAVGRVLPRQCR